MNTERLPLHEPYELTLMNLSELEATVKKDEDDRFFAKIGNKKYQFNPEFPNPHLPHLDRLRMVLKLSLFNYKLKHKEIRYCEACNHNLIIDPRPFVDVCNDCLKKG